MAYSGKTHAISRRFMSAALAVLLVAAFVPFQAVVFGVTTTGTTWYVDDAAGDDGGAGTATDPLATLYEAVHDRAEDGDTILVKPGHYDIYEGRLDIDGFSNLRIASTAGADVTTLCGDGSNGALAVVGSDGIVIEGFTIHYGDAEYGAGIYFSAVEAKVKDCVIADNYSWQGAGLYSVESTIVVEGCEFTRNFAEGYGSGISAEGSNVTINDCEFTENGESPWDSGVYTWYAGAAELYESDVTISGTTFADNIAESAGGVGAWGCDLTITESVFKENFVEWSDDFFDGRLLDSAEAAEQFDIDSSRTWTSDAQTADVGALQGGEPERLSGGGIGLYAGDYDISGTQFVGNSADDAGGGVYAGFFASARISDCTFEENDAFMGGGTFFTDSWTEDALFEAESLGEAAEICASGEVIGLPEMPELAFDVERTVFSGNSSYVASAIFIDGEFVPTAVTNTLFERNEAWAGGVVVAVPADMIRPSGAAVELEPRLSMANCTFAENVSGLSLSLATADFADVRNTVFWGNTDSGTESEGAPFDAVDAIFLGEDVEFSYCDFEYGYAAEEGSLSMAGEGNFSADPMFADDYNLTSGSPCIDTGTEEGAPLDDIDGWMRPMDGDNDGVRAWDVGAYEYYDNLVRDVGMNRYATAVKACQQHFDSADTVIVATGEVFADGLSAAGLAGSYEAPILLSPKATMPALVKTEIKRLGATHAVVIGGEDALSSSVMSDLKAMGLSVERIGGVNRYSTAAMVATKIAAREGADFTGVGFVARGDNFPDALSVSPIAYAMKSPILLVKPDSLPQATVDVIEAVDFDEFLVAGGPDAVSSMAVGGLAADTTQIGGLDRYDTSAKVSDYAVAKGWAQMSYTGIATGENFPDALTGGAALGSENGVLLLTPYKALHSSPKFLMEKRADEVNRVEVLGGTSAVSETVWNSIASILD